MHRNSLDNFDSQKKTNHLEKRRRTIIPTISHPQSKYDPTDVVIIDDAEDVAPPIKIPRLQNSQSVKTTTVSPDCSIIEEPASIEKTIQMSGNVRAQENSGKLGNRRKTCHQSLKVDDDISFVTCILPDTDFDKTTSLSKVIKNEPDSEMKWTEKLESKNPNAQLMKKVAFLRVCVNYMMLSLKKKRFEFKATTSLPLLLSMYHKQIK